MKVRIGFYNYQNNRSGTSSLEVPDDLSRLLRHHITKKRIKKKALAKEAGMSDIYICQILSRVRKPSRERLIRISIALRLSLSETQNLLITADLPILACDDKWDMIIIQGLNMQKEMNQINDDLFSAKETLLL